MNLIAILDYGMGNLRSVAQAMKTAAPEADVRITHEPEVVRAAERIILPDRAPCPIAWRICAPVACSTL